MKKFDFKKINEKSKSEQIFILLALCFISLGIFCITGCGTQNCENISCECNEAGDAKVKVISLPGLGGLCSSGEGCGCALWAQSCKIVFVNDDEHKAKISAFDIQYYDKNSLGCAYLDSCYIGCIEGSCENNAIFYGANNNDDMIVGCVKGSCACEDYGNGVRQDLTEWETLD